MFIALNLMRASDPTRAALKSVLSNNFSEIFPQDKTCYQKNRKIKMIMIYARIAISDQFESAANLPAVGFFKCRFQVWDRFSRHAKGKLPFSLWIQRQAIIQLSMFL